MDNNVNLIQKDNGLCLEGDGMEIRCDFSSLLKRIKPNNLGGELIVKAAKISGRQLPLTIIDATAGLGEDSFLLAAAGFNVILFERDEVIASLLADGLKRALNDELTFDAASRMTLRCEDSIKALPTLNGVADIVFLDPMFPERTKSAEVKKKFQLIHRLEKPCEDEKELLDAAYSANPERIIIKRPLKGPYLCDKKPSYSLSGKAIRYDCIALGRKKDEN